MEPLEIEGDLIIKQHTVNNTAAEEALGKINVNILDSASQASIPSAIDQFARAVNNLTSSTVEDVIVKYEANLAEVIAWREE